MFLIDKKEFSKLADFHAPHCISIFMPTHRSGMEVKKDHDLIQFRNHLKKLENDLEEYGLKKPEIDKKLNPAREMLEDSNLWHNLSDGLAVFIGDKFFEYYTLPIRFEDYHYIADHFYLRPLMPMYHGDGRFFILALSMEKVRFFEATRHTITDVRIEDLVPEEIREVVGYDYEEKSLQWRAGQTGNTGEGTMFHGQGRNTSDDKDEIKRFCRAVNDGLMKMLHDETPPMVVACVDYIFPIYKEVNDYKYLYPKNIDGNTDEMKPIWLHEQAWDVVKPHFQKHRKEQKERFEGLLSDQRASYKLNEIVPAAVNGKVETLYIQSRNDAYGIFDAPSQEIRVDQSKTTTNASLLNMAAIKTFQQGGKVYLMEPEEMPSENTLVNAIFRY